MTELVPLSPARERADQIRAHLTDVASHMEALSILADEAYREQDWQPLGYDSWDAYCKAEFQSQYLNIPVEARRVITEQLAAAGASTRQIASATGVSQPTAQRDIEATRGRTRTTDPAPEEIRAWARDNGIPISERGRIAGSVVEQYRAAQGKPPKKTNDSAEPKPAETFTVPVTIQGAVEELNRQAKTVLDEFRETLYELVDKQTDAAELEALANLFVDASDRATDRQNELERLERQNKK